MKNEIVYGGLIATMKVFDNAILCNRGIPVFLTGLYMYHMNINILVGVPVTGTLSPTTQIKREIVCTTCNRRRTQYSDITYVFDRWSGEDIVSGRAEYFISQRLKEKLEEKNIKGYKITPLKTSFSEQGGGIRRFGEGAYQKELPDFYYFEIKGKAKGAIDDWFEVIDTTECEGCKESKKMLSMDGIRSMSNPDLIGKDTDNPLPRNVYKESWQGDDVFLLQDSMNLPMVSGNFIGCLTALGIKLSQREGVWIRATNWINE